MKLQLWYLYSLPVILASSLACSLLSQPTGNLPPSRTPLPTFTATSLASDTLEIATPLPGDTPTPAPPVEPTPEPPTATPPPPAPPEEIVEGDVPPKESGAGEPSDEAESTNDEATEAEPAPQVAPTSPPPPPEAPPSEPAVGAYGVIGKISFRDGRNTYGVGEKVFVKIEATNTEPGQKPFGILGLTTSTGAFQTSWSSGTIDGTFTHEDGVAFSSPGNHKIWLSICFSTEQVCQGADGEWERFEPGLDVIIQ